MNFDKINDQYRLGLGMYLCRYVSFKNNSRELEFEFFNSDIRVLNLVALILRLEKRFINTDNSFVPWVRITHVNRDWEKQDDIYTNHPNKEISSKYLSKPWPSVHMYRPSCAIDLVIPTGIMEQHQSLADMVNCFQVYEDGKHDSVLIHDAGSGNHFHLQCRPMKYNKFVSGQSRYAIK